MKNNLSVKKQYLSQNKELFGKEIFLELENNSKPLKSVAIDDTWYHALQSEFSKDYWKSLTSTIRGLYKEKTVYPNPKKVFNAFDSTPLDKVKVVIIGQDPYHGMNQATGLCFGVNPDVKKPPSLRNIEKELIKDTGEELRDPTLENWARQGVLLLNSSLTVVEKAPGTHMTIWRRFTHDMLHQVGERSNKTVFVVWGGFALNILANVQPDSTKHKIIISSHPSPLSYSRGLRGHTSFKNSKIFIRVNELLENHTINW